MKFAEKVTILRKRKGLSQAELGEKLSLSKQAVQKWESGAGMPDISIMKPLSKILDCSIDILLDDEADVSLIEEKEKIEIPRQKMSYQDLHRRKYGPVALLAISGLIIILVGIIGVIVVEGIGGKIAFGCVIFVGVFPALFSIYPLGFVLRRYEVEGHEIVAYAGATNHYLIIDEEVVDYLEKAFTLKDAHLKGRIGGKEVDMTITGTNNVTLRVDGEVIFPKK